MTAKFTGSVEDRYRYLDKTNRRCDGNNRICLNAAVDQFTLIRAVDFQPLPGEEPQIKRSCARHRHQFTRGSMWHITDTIRIGYPTPAMRARDNRPASA